MANLLLYAGITPNANNKHYLYNDIANFKTALQSYLIKSVTLDNFRINSAVIKVKIDETITTENYKNVTYAINENDNVCYIVKSGILQSGFVIYDCDVDYWGTYIAQASLSHINVLRCNRNIDIGVYDNINTTKNNVQTRFDIPNGDYVIDNSTTPPTEYKQYYKFENAYIVFCMTYNIAQTGAGSTSATGMFAFNLKTLYQKFVALNKNLLYTNPIELARACVGGIYGVQGSNGYGLTSILDARVIKAYIMPKELIHASTSSLGIKVISKSMYGNFADSNALDVLEVSNLMFHKDFTLNINPNYNYYVGTINKGLKITRDTSGATVIRYQGIVNNNDIQVIVKQGDNQQDITSEFEIDLTYNEGDVTNLSGIKQALKMGLSTVGTLASGNYLSAGLNLAGGVVDTMGQHHIGKQAGNGDAVTTFYKTGNTSIGLGLAYPYGFTTCESTSDEQVNARNKGAFYDCYVPSLSNIFRFEFIGVGTQQDATFVQAKLCVDNVPSQAITEITTRLSKGVYMVKL